MKNELVKVAKQLIEIGAKEELYSLFKVCKDSSIDISKEIDYDYKEKYEGSKVLMITLKVIDYKTTDKYIQDYIRCYIEVDNMVSEGIESMAVVQSKKADDLGTKVIESLNEMKLDILREIVSDSVSEGLDPEKFLKDFKILYHYDKGSELLNEYKDEIQKDLDPEEFMRIKSQVLEEMKSFEDIQKSFSKGDLDE